MLIGSVDGFIIFSDNLLSYMRVIIVHLVNLTSQLKTLDCCLYDLDLIVDLNLLTIELLWGCTRL